MKYPLIEEAMSVKYKDRVIDITKDWQKMTPKERQEAVIKGLHIETDRSGKRVFGNISRSEQSKRIKEAVIKKQQEKRSVQ
jgi:hypothetical protein